jgi:hypothetical protein
MIDLNHRSGFVYGREHPVDIAGARVNALIDRALVEANQRQAPRDYLGASRSSSPNASARKRLASLMACRSMSVLSIMPKFLLAIADPAPRHRIEQKR